MHMFHDALVSFAERQEMDMEEREALEDLKEFMNGY